MVQRPCVVVLKWCRDPVVWWSWSGAETLWCGGLGVVQRPCGVVVLEWCRDPVVWWSWSGAETLWSSAEALWCGGFEVVQKPCSVVVSEWFKRSPKLSGMSGVEEKVDVFKRFCLPLSAN